MSDLGETVRYLRRAGEQTACIFRPRSAPRSIGSADLMDGLESAFAARLHVRFVDEDFLSSYEAMYKCPIGLLVIPALETVPERSFLALSGFLSRGGAMLISSRDFFMREEGRDYVPLFEPRRQHEDEYFRRTAALLGLKPYTAAVMPRAAVVDVELLPGLPARLPIRVPPNGIWCTTGSDKLRPEPPYGHAFPERMPTARNYAVVQGTDPLGTVVTSSVVFSQGWESGSRLVAVASNGEGSMLDPRSPWLAPFLSGVADLCASRVCVVSIDPDLACYRPGEQVGLEIEVASFHREPVTCELAIRITGNGRVRFEKTEQFVAAPGVPLRLRRSELFSDFGTDQYAITASLSVGGHVRSRASNGFVVWDDDVARRGPAFSISGTQFSFGDRGSLVTGTNYYESRLGELMWLKPDVAGLSAGLSAMAAAGINYLRIHYHHPRWFWDYMRARHGEVPAFFEPAPAPLPEEKFLRIFDAHVYLCQKLGIVYGGDLFTLLPEALGDPRGWFGVHDYSWLQEKIELQKRFLALLLPRYIHVPGIAWDLYNEPHGIDDLRFLAWATEIRETIRGLGDTHAITVGSENPARYAQIVDFFAEHRNFRMAGKIRISGSKPEMLQEAWLDRPPTPEGERDQRDDMRSGLLSAFGSGLSGFAPWQWTNQERLRGDFHAFEGEIWDDRLGCCTRDDGTMKPAGIFYRAFCQLVHGISVQGSSGHGFLTNRGELVIRSIDGGEPAPGGLSIALIEGNKLLAGLARGRIMWRGELLVEADKDCDLWFAADDDGINLRTDEACLLTVHGWGRPARKAGLRRAPRGCGDLYPVELSVTADRVSVAMEDWFSGFWLHLHA